MHEALDILLDRENGGKGDGQEEVAEDATIEREAARQAALREDEED